MPLNTIIMQELFRRYLDNQCSPEDVKELLAYFNNPKDETELRALIFNSLEEVHSEVDDSQCRTDGFNFCTD